MARTQGWSRQRTSSPSACTRMPAWRCPWHPMPHPMIAGTCVCTWTGLPSRYRARAPRAGRGMGCLLYTSPSPRD
eukprot:6694613-Alexandrium_andersonii.AAC.1